LANGVDCAGLITLLVQRGDRDSGFEGVKMDRELETQGILKKTNTAGISGVRG
jgi:hypothetical protein